MVKTNAALPALAVALLAACTPQRPVAIHPQAVVVAGSTAPGPVSAAAAGGRVTVVYADRATATLSALEIDPASALPGSPVARVIDTVDFAPPLTAAFGEHVLATADTTVVLLYADRVAQDSTVLKVATRAPAAVAWTVDVLQPPGRPLAALSSRAEGGPGTDSTAFWTTDALYTQDLPARGGPRVLRAFHASSPASLLGPAGFTAWNDDDGALYLVQPSEGGAWNARRLSLGARVHSSLVAADGTLSVLSWRPQNRRLLLETLSPRGEVARTTVTLCEGTTRVALLEGPRPGEVIAAFDETRPARGGPALHRLSLIAPAAVLGARGTGWREASLYESAAPFGSFAVVRAGGVLVAAVSAGSVAVVRAVLPGLSSR